MGLPENIEELKLAVHKPLEWSDYDSTNINSVTNCFSHAIGSTVISNPKLYRLGMISSKKSSNEEYISSKEVKELFGADLTKLDLEAKEMVFKSFNKYSVIKAVSESKLQTNQYIVLLFVKDYGRIEEKIKDFHFIRFDYEKGWTEKLKGNIRFFKDILEECPSNWFDKLIGVFLITR